MTSLAAEGVSLPATRPTTEPVSNKSWFNWVSYILPFRYSSASTAPRAVAGGLPTVTAGPGQPALSPLEESVLEDNWVLMESELDRLYQATTNKKADEIRGELAALRSHSNAPRARISNTQVLFDTLPRGDSKYLASPLTANDRASICAAVVSEEASTWFSFIRSVYETNLLHKSISSVDVVFERFTKDFYESKYNKNVVGTMKDVAFFIYNAASLLGLTNRILDEILASWSRRIILCLKENLKQGEIDPKVTALVDSMLLTSCRKLLRLHIQVAKNSKNVEQREGKLPGKWEAESEERKETLERIKQTGADAKWEDPMEKKNKASAKENQLADQSTIGTAIGNTTKVKSLLEKRLFFRPPASK